MGHETMVIIQDAIKQDQFSCQRHSQVPQVNVRQSAVKAARAPLVVGCVNKKPEPIRSRPSTANSSLGDATDKLTTILQAGNQQISAFNARKLEKLRDIINASLILIRK